MEYGHFDCLALFRAEFGPFLHQMGSGYALFFGLRWAPTWVREQRVGECERHSAVAYRISLQQPCRICWMSSQFWVGPHIAMNTAIQLIVHQFYVVCLSFWIKPNLKRLLLHSCLKLQAFYWHFTKENNVNNHVGYILDNWCDKQIRRFVLVRSIQVTQGWHACVGLLSKSFLIFTQTRRRCQW